MQASPSTTNGLFEFGPFRVDAQKRVLLRRGEPIPLTPKAFETLLVLIQNNGQPVPKDDLMRTLWPDSFVEEGNLTQNIFVLRKALGSNNRYIVTIPGRGYQFVEPVRQIAENPEALNGETQFHPPAGVRLARHSMLHRHLWLGLGAAVCLCAILGLFAYRRRVRLGQAKTSAPAGLVRRSVAVLGFQNLSRRQANDWLSTAIGEMLTTELAAGQQIRTVPGEDVSRMKISLALADADTYNRTTLGRIRSNVHTDDVVFGSYVPLSGGQIRIDVRVQDTAKGELLAAISEKGSEANVDDLVIRTGAALRKAFATAPVTPAEAATVAASMPVDAQAAKLYASGLAKLRLLDNLGARDLLQQALAIEPTFAPGHLAMSQVWSNLGYDQKAREEAGKAFDNAGRLSRPEQLRIEARYRLTNQEWGKAVDISRSLFEFFPDSLDDGLLLAQAQAHAGKFSDALGTVDQLRANSLFSDEPMLNLEESEIAGRMGDFRREVSSALRAIQQAQRQGSRLINAAAERDA
jgi:DNA-binding winged helix-turn-helix (wHTH) protein/TolB-like protein